MFVVSLPTRRCLLCARLSLSDCIRHLSSGWRNKHSDLRERERGVGGDELGTSVGVGKERNAFSTGALDNIERKRLHVKQSIYQALNTLKAHSHSDFHSHTLAKARRQQRQPPPSPEPSSLPLGEENAHSTPPPPTPAQTTTHWPLEDPRYRKYAMTYPSPVIPHIPPADRSAGQGALSPNDSIVTETGIEVLVVEFIQASRGSARCAHYDDD